MRITKIVLAGFERFKTNEIKHFSLEIKEPLLVILGSNGSGKTSLLRQLTPYPPHPSEFEKTGSKEIYITHNNSQYVLKSTFSSGQKHFFSVDGLVLNDWGTVTVQKELVSTHFNVNASTLGLTLGEERFSAMNTSKRKEWLVHLCETDYLYAIQVYNKLREKHRDIQGALKIAQRRLNAETQKQLGTEEQALLLNQANLLHNCLNDLLEERKPVESDTHTLGLEQEKLSSQILRFKDKLNKLMEEVSRYPRYTQQGISDLLARVDTNTSACSAVLQTYSQQHATLDEKVTTLQKAEEQTIDSLQRSIFMLKGTQSAKQAKMLFTEDDFDAQTAHDAFTSIKSILIDIFAEIPCNVDRKYSSEKLNEAKQTLLKLQNNRKLVGAELQSTHAAKLHMESHQSKPNVTCEKCNHRFSLHFDQVKLDGLNTHCTNLKNRLEVLDAETVILEAYIQQCSQYANLYRQYHQLTTSTKTLYHYWDYLSARRVVTDKPESGNNALLVIDRDLILQISYAQVQKEIKDKEELLQSMKKVGSGDLKELVTQRSELENLIGIQTNRLVRLGQKKAKYTILSNQIKQLDNANQYVNKILEEKDKLNTEQQETIRRQHFNQAVKELQSALASKEHILNQNKMQQGVINHIQLQISELEKEEKAYTLLVKALSVSDGLIAEGLFGFINELITRMNHIVDQVWQYPMTIMPCTLDGENVDLDYKFPVKISTSGAIKDVADGSKGQVDMMDMAFLITAMSYMGMTDSALILDEMGSSFDTEHRTALIILIKSLVEQQSFNQIFMVSHDYHQWSALNAQVIKLVNSTEKLPSNYNEHVQMQ
jgi:energy-coupling factor transporter ATP-binding protein EcfA2